MHVVFELLGMELATVCTTAKQTAWHSDESDEFWEIRYSLAEIQQKRDIKTTEAAVV